MLPATATALSPTAVWEGGEGPTLCLLLWEHFHLLKWKILPEKKVGKWAHTFKSLYRLYPHVYSSVTLLWFLVFLLAWGQGPRWPQLCLVGYSPVLLALHTHLISPLLGVVVQKSLPSFVSCFNIFKRSHWLSVFYYIQVILATGKICDNPAGEKMFHNVF